MIKFVNIFDNAPITVLVIVFQGHTIKAILKPLISEAFVISMNLWRLRRNLILLKLFYT